MFIQWWNCLMCIYQNTLSYPSQSDKWLYLYNYQDCITIAIGSPHPSFFCVCMSVWYRVLNVGPHACSALFSTTDLNPSSHYPSLLSGLLVVCPMHVISGSARDWTNFVFRFLTLPFVTLCFPWFPPQLSPGGIHLNSVLWLFVTVRLFLYSIDSITHMA